MIESLLDYRGNVQFFDEELIPPKQDIIDILNVVHQKMPHVAMKWLYNLNLLGPDDWEDKKKMAVSGFCGLREKELYYRTIDILPDKDIKHLYKVYEKWRKYQREELRNDIAEPQPDDPDIYCFNEQVRAPWVIAYRRNSKKSESHRADIQIGNHSMLTALLALQKGYDVSFCSCFIFRKEFQYNMWKDKEPIIMLTLSIGYPLLPRRTNSYGSKLPPHPSAGQEDRPSLESIIL